MKVHLSSGYEDKPLAPHRTHLFGQLVKLAQPVVQAYQGDLLHDASTLLNAESILGTWYFITRDSGTNLTRHLWEALAITRANRGNANFHLYAVHVVKKERTDSYYAFIVESDAPKWKWRTETEWHDIPAYH